MTRGYVRSSIRPASLQTGPGRTGAPNQSATALFDGDDRMFKSLFDECRTYGEYGCGASTAWVLKNSPARVLAVDTSADWIERIRNWVGPDPRLDLHWVDVGPVLNWGRPASYEKRRNFSDYTDWIWRRGASPDIVLVDGRFRVCCFLTSLKHARPGAKIVFDDYCDRPYYHVVEEFLAPSQTCGRQALFVKPEHPQFDPDLLVSTIGQFAMVMD